MQRERRQSIFTLLRPDLESIGYALFLAINAAGVWGGVFPFLPLAFQTPKILFWFFLSQSLAFSASFALSCVGAYFLPGPTRRFSVKLASAPYFLGWCCLIAAIYLDGAALALVVAGGVLLGLGSAGFYMLWQRLFASQDADGGSRRLLVGTAWGAVLYYALHLIPQAVTAYLIPAAFLPLFGLVVTLRSRTINLDQPMFEDVPQDHPAVYAHALRGYWRSALCVGALGFCAGIMRSVAVAEPSIGIYVNNLSMAGMLVAALVTIWLWRLKGIRLSITDAYRVVFPFLITSFLGLPLLSDEYARWLAAILYAVYSAAIMLMMMQCAQVSRDRGVNPVFIYGFFGAVVFALHSVGFLGGTFAEDIRVMGLSPLAIVAMVAVWALGLMHFVGSGGFTSTLAARGRDEAIELASLRTIVPGRRAGADGADAVGGKKAAAGGGGDAPAGAGGGAGGATGGDARAAAGGGAGGKSGVGSALGAGGASAPAGADEAAPAAGGGARGAGGVSAAGPLLPAEATEAADLLAAQAQRARERYRLSAREAEVMELIARGHSVARIAEMLVVSENTIRTHSKRIYTKLDIHKKQELLDLLETL